VHTSDSTMREQDLDQLTGELHRLMRLLERVQARHAAQESDGLERATFLLLVHLVKGGPRRLGALAEAVHSDASTVSRQAAALVKLGLAERQADPDDGRASLLAATEAGVRVFQDKRRRRNELSAQLLADWTAEDRRRLRELLVRFNDDYERFFLCPGAPGALLLSKNEGKTR
jgi:DNA-binding MarR family transcriptional regulator